MRSGQLAAAVAKSGDFVCKIPGKLWKTTPLEIPALLCSEATCGFYILGRPHFQRY